MEVVEFENVVIENSVIIRGMTNTEFDEDLTDFLNKYGRICRHLCIDDPKLPYHRDVIIEYSSCSALVTLKPLLPYIFKSPHNVVYHTRLLSRVYASAVTEQATTHYFAELKIIAKLSFKTFEELLKEQLLSTTASAAESLIDANYLESSQINHPSLSDIPLPPKQAEYSEGGQHSDTAYCVINGSFSPPLNPPEVQRMVVEHILRSDVVSSFSTSFRLRVFSGRILRPSGEVDYDTWRNSIELLLQDHSLSDLNRSRKILDSLLPPAAEMVKQIGAKALPAAYLDALDSAFDIVEDSDDLFA